MRIVIRIMETVCLCLQVIVAFGSIWIFFTTLSEELPAGAWVQYPLGIVAFAGGIALLFPELSALGVLILVPTWSIFLVLKLLVEGNPFLEVSMVSIAMIIAMVHYHGMWQILRTHRLPHFPIFRAAWWRKGLRYGIPVTLIFTIVGTLFYFFQKAEGGKYEIQGVQALDQGQYQQAIADLNRAIRIAEKFPRSNWRVIQGTYNLGRAYLRSKQLPLAEATFRESLRMSQSELDPTDPHYVLYYRSLDALATTYVEQARHPEAEALYLQAVASYATWSPPASAVNGFVRLVKVTKYVGELFHDQNTVVESNKQLQFATDFELATQVDGLPSALDGLAGFYFGQDEFKKAEQYYKRGLFLKTKILASQFPNLGQDLLDIPIMTDDQGKPLEGLALYEKVRPYVDHMSPENRSTIDVSLNQIALTYWEQGRNKEAEPLYLLSLALKRSISQEHTPAYAVTLTNLGLLYNTMGKYSEAEPKLLAALAIRERILSPNHPDLAHSYNNLALLYDKLNQAKKAEPLYKHALAIRQQSLGPNHPKSILTLGLLANLYFRDAQFSKAEPLFIELLRLKQQEVGHSHLEVLGLIWQLGGIYSEEGKYQAAISTYEELLSRMEEPFAPHSDTFRQALSSFEYVLRRAGRVKQAEEVKKRIQELTPGALSSLVPPLLESKHRTK